MANVQKENIMLDFIGDVFGWIADFFGAIFDFLFGWI